MEMTIPEEPDIDSIARVYLEAFPESVEFFFDNCAEERVARIVSAGFRALWEAGCRIIVAREPDAGVLGYCAVALDEAELRTSFLKDGLWLRLTKDLLLRRIPLRLGEAVRLGANGAAFLFSSLLTLRGEVGGRIFSIAVRRDSRGRGLGREMLSRALALVAKKGVKIVRLEVRPENRAAVRLYRSVGFREVGTVKDLRGPWLAMEKTL
ncbi:MAG: GNAT family N-acetyltransferase [Bacillota bacterium]